MPTTKPILRILGTLAVLLGATLGMDAQKKDRAMEQQVFYRTVKVDGLSIFYREAGPKGAPTLLLRHGLPSSSRMFQPLLTRLSDSYHLVAPDYPGFGHSDWPDPKQFDYTFDHIATVMDGFTQALGLSHYTLYMQDYGGPVGFRMALAHPERVEALIVQDAVSHNEGLGANWATRRAFWADRPAHEEALRTNLLSLATTKTRHIGDDPNVELYDPDLWADEYAFLNAPGQAQIQSDLFYDYRTNVDTYPKMAGLDAEATAKAFSRLGKARSLVRCRRTGTLPQGRTERGGLRARRRTLRARYQSRRDCGAGTWLHEDAEVNSVPCAFGHHLRARKIPTLRTRGVGISVAGYS
jgi:pimeloyl-ACP methyl ester carboxylesterase